jgi:hypothetical protein
VIMNGPVQIGSNKAAEVFANRLAHQLRYG